MDKDKLREQLAREMKSFVKRHGGAEKVSLETGIPKGTIYGWTGNRAVPSVVDFIQLYQLAGGHVPAEVFPGVFSEAESEMVSIPVYDVRLAAGDGAINDRANVIDQIPFKKNYLDNITRGINTRHLAIFEARGDSMLPTIADRDLVLVDTSDNQISDGIFAYSMMGEARLKRFQTSFDSLTIVSDNKSLYEAEPIPLSVAKDIEIIGRVKLRIGKL